MTTYVEVAVNVPQVSGTFHYHLPPELEGRCSQVTWWKCRSDGSVCRGWCSALSISPRCPRPKR